MIAKTRSSDSAASDKTILSGVYLLMRLYPHAGNERCYCVCYTLFVKRWHEVHPVRGHTLSSFRLCENQNRFHGTIVLFLLPWATKPSNTRTTERVSTFPRVTVAACGAVAWWRPRRPAPRAWRSTCSLPWRACARATVQSELRSRAEAMSLHPTGQPRE